MPANQRHQTAQLPPSPTSKATAKYTNKDGSKFITVPKSSSSNSPSEASPTMAQTNTKSSAPLADTPAVNRKKQKRREKQAAKLAAAQTVANGTNGSTSMPGNAKGHAHAQYGSHFHEGELDDSDGEEDMDSGSFENGSASANGFRYTPDHLKGAKKKKKTQRGNRDTSTSNIPPPPPPPPPEASANPRPGMTREKIWNTSSAEERERIKEFWLSLGEEERKSLVKVEKDAVLKKMKEQQKHSCSCTVCGRKRLAIEEELEVLYDAYYEELEQYAHTRQGDPPLMRNSRRLGAMSGFHSPHQLPPAFHPSRGRIENPGEEDLDEDGEEEYSEEDEDIDEYSEDEPPEDQSQANDFFNFGNSLTVKGGILTVADDLLKNDGKKFIEMMEQLAERRMQREEDAERQFANGGYHPNGGIPSHHHSHAGHNHPPPQPEEEYDDEDDEDEDDYDDEEEEYDDEEMDSMTEEQRMEEGRRMFQIFAARMFEQRVLTAYKEKVAKERQEKLFEELDEENQAETQRKAKKAKEAQKRKEKAQQKKQALAEEKAKREADEAERAAAQRAIEEKKAEEQRLRQEEKRKKREAQKKAEDEERLRKEAEKQKRLQDQRERQAEAERKQREAKEREKKEKEEARLKAQEAKEAKEREARERKERQENERKERQETERKEKEAKAKEAQKQAEKQKKLDEQAALAEREEARKKSMPVATHTAQPHSQQPLKRLPQQPISIPIPPGLQPHPVHSPQVQVAMPILPKAPTPIRPRTVSQQHEMSNVSIPQTPQYGTGKSQDPSPAPSTPLQSSPSVLGSGNNRPYLHHPQATSPIHAALRGSPGPMHHQNLPAGMHPLPMNGFPPPPPPQTMNQMYSGSRLPSYDPPAFTLPMQQPGNNQFRPPPGMPMHAPQSMPQGRAFPYGPPGFQQQPPTGPISSILQSFSPSRDSASTQSHSRNVSGSFENGLFSGMNYLPNSKPTPIGRPSSVVHAQRPGSNHRSENKDVDELSNHLGSSALLDDSYEPFSFGTGRRSSVAPGMSRGGFANSAGSFMDQSGLYGSWTNPSNPFGNSSLPGGSTWGSNLPPSLGGWGSSISNAFNNSNSAIRAGHPRSVTVRLALCKAYKRLASTTSDGFVEMSIIRDQVEKILCEDSLNERELLEMCETEGNSINGGGYFDIKSGINHNYIKHVSDDGGRTLGAPGEIGSPIVGSGVSPFGGRIGGNFGPLGGF